MRNAVRHNALLRDTLLALLVLALTFLNFGHTSAVFAAGGRVVVTSTATCGDVPSVPSGDHAPCHGCRPDLAVLPSAPQGAEPVEFVPTPVVYVVAVAPAQTLVWPVALPARGPPAAA